MIKMQDLTPEVYFNNSRDFQLIGHLFDLVLNATKTEAEILFSLPLSENSPDQLLNLMAMTFGLKLDMTKYTATQLRAICSIAPKMMKTKGSLQAVHYLIAALMRTEGSSEEYLVEQDKLNPYHITILLPTQAKHKIILDEILPYILPAGMTYSIKQAFIVTTQTDTKYGYSDRVTVAKEYSIDKATLVDHKLISDTDKLNKLNFFTYRETNGTTNIDGSKQSFWPVASLHTPTSAQEALPDAESPTNSN